MSLIQICAKWNFRYFYQGIYNCIVRLHLILKFTPILVLHSAEVKRSECSVAVINDARLKQRMANYPFWPRASLPNSSLVELNSIQVVYLFLQAI